MNVTPVAREKNEPSISHGIEVRLVVSEDWSHERIALLLGETTRREWLGEFYYNELLPSCASGSLIIPQNTSTIWLD